MKKFLLVLLVLSGVFCCASNQYKDGKGKCQNCAPAFGTNCVDCDLNKGCLSCPYPTTVSNGYVMCDSSQMPLPEYPALVENMSPDWHIWLIGFQTLVIISLLGYIIYDCGTKQVAKPTNSDKYVEIVSQNQGLISSQ